MSGFFPMNMEVRHGRIREHSLFNACMGWVLGKAVDQNHCKAFVGDISVTALVYVHHTLILAELLEVLVLALEAIHEEAKPLGLEIY